MKTRTIYICLALLLTAFSVHAKTVIKEFKKTVDFRPNGTVYIRNNNGNIELESWENDYVDIYAEIIVRDKDDREAQDLLDEIQIKIEESGDRISIVPEYSSRTSSNNFWDWIFGSNSPPVINFKVKVPLETSPELESMNGNIMIENIRGVTKAGTLNGGIRLYRMQGSVDAHTTNGSIEAMLISTDRDDDVQIKTINGSIIVSLSEDIAAYIKASTINGGIETDLPLTIKGKILKKNIEASLNGGGGHISLSTVNGGIRINKH